MSDDHGDLVFALERLSPKPGEILVYYQEGPVTEEAAAALSEVVDEHLRQQTAPGGLDVLFFVMDSTTSRLATYELRSSALTAAILSAAVRGELQNCNDPNTVARLTRALLLSGHYGYEPSEVP
jgi:hypothetical protein